MGSEGEETETPMLAGKEPENKKMRTSVWWDIAKFDVPQWCEPYTISENIRLSLREVKCKGPIKIYVYGDVDGMNQDLKLPLKNTGVVFNHISSGAKDIKDMMVVDMLSWAVDNPAPANILLIADDPDFSYALHQLRIRRYNIFLAQSQYVSETLAAAAKNVWVWSSILVGGRPLSDYQSSQYGNITKVPERPVRGSNEPNMFRALSALAMANSSKSNLPNGSSGDSNQLQMQQFKSSPHDFFAGNKPESPKVMSAPHDFFSANKPAKVISSSVPSNPDLFRNNDMIIPDNQPSKLVNLPSQPNFPPDSSYHGYPSGPEYPVSSQDCRTFQERIDVSWNSGCAEPYEYVQALIGVILLALNTLKRDKMIPNEANITDCIRYGDPMHQGTDVRKALNYAIEHRMVVKQGVGVLLMYVGKNDKIWKCVNPLDPHPVRYSDETWDGVRKYLTSADGQSAMMASKCRYEAAVLLRDACVKDLPLGQVLQMLNVITSTKKWIKTHHSGWQPIKITLPDESTDSISSSSS